MESGLLTQRPHGGLISDCATKQLCEQLTERLDFALKLISRHILIMLGVHGQPLKIYDANAKGSLFIEKILKNPTVWIQFDPQISLTSYNVGLACLKCLLKCNKIWVINVKGFIWDRLLFY